MRTDILKLLRSDAQTWWYHQQLRRQGKVAEARKRERASILSGLEMLRGPKPTYFKNFTVQWDREIRAFPVRGSTDVYHVSIGNVHPGLWIAMQAVHGILEPCQ